MMKTKRLFLYKILQILPLTFVFLPLLYPFLGYQQSIKFFKLWIYLYYAIFIYLGVGLSFILRKFKYIAYPIVIIFAFVCKNIVYILNITRTVIYNEEIFLRPADKEELAYYAMILFLTSVLCGCFGIFYSQKTALEFISRKNIFLFANILAIGCLYFMVCGIIELDKTAINLVVSCVILFALSYLTVRNFALINKQIEVYSEHGTHKVSGMGHVYKYYFVCIVLFAAVPAFLANIVIPWIIRFIEFIVKLIAGIIFSFFNFESENEVNISYDYYVGDNVSPILKDSAETIVSYDYYIVLAVFFIIIFLLRKQILALIKYLIEALFSRSAAEIKQNQNNDIISSEIVENIGAKQSELSYKDFLKRYKKIKGMREKFLFAYNYIFWKNAGKSVNITPRELAKKCKDDEFSKASGLYEDLKYGLHEMNEEELPIKI